MLDNSPSKMEDREGRRLDQMAEIREAINHFIALLKFSQNSPAQDHWLFWQLSQYLGGICEDERTAVSRRTERWKFFGLLEPEV